MKKQLTQKRQLFLICFLLFFGLSMLPLLAFSQKTVKTYFDYEHQKVHEVYSVDGYGVKNGSYTEYTEYGGIVQQGTYNKDGKVGKWITHDQNGELLLEENFDNNSQYNGQVVRYMHNYKYAQESYKHGIKDGNWKTWFTDENRFNTIYLKPDGTTQLQYDEYYKDGSQDSVKKEYDRQGVMLSKITYKHGVAEGKAEYYAMDGSGEIMQKGAYQNDSMRGEWKIVFNGQNKWARKKTDAMYYRIINYGEIGTKLFVATDYYVTGEKQSDETIKKDGGFISAYTEYYKNGKVSLKGKYNDMGKQDSIWTTYKVNGGDSIKENYINGNLEATPEQKQLLANQQELATNETKVASLYNVFTALYGGRMEEQVNYKTGASKDVYNYPYGKYLFLKSDSLIKFMQAAAETSTDINFKLNKNNDLITLLNKLISLSGANTKAINDQMQIAKTNYIAPYESRSLSGADTKAINEKMEKAQTMNDIKVVLGL